MVATGDQFHCQWSRGQGSRSQPRGLQGAELAGGVAPKAFWESPEGLHPLQLVVVIAESVEQRLRFRTCIADLPFSDTERPQPSGTSWQQSTE